MVISSSFLFCDALSAERLRWFTNLMIGAPIPGGSLLKDGAVTCTIFLTGDALFSLVDAGIRKYWETLSAVHFVEIIADGDELRLQGLLDPVTVKSPSIIVSGGAGSETEADFWDALVSRLREEWKGTQKAAFLLCNSPYMSRVPVYMLRYLTSAMSSGLHPELYTYLDGVHTVHSGQHPSEFENIGLGVSAITVAAELSGRDPWFAACSRCATARGYYQLNPRSGLCEPSSCVDDITIQPLKVILDRFPGRHPILSHMCGEIVIRDQEEKEAGFPRLSIFITNPPYGTEWTFGGLSLALAAAMGGIETMVIFIEQGVYALCGTHVASSDDKVFNVQEMIAATNDIPGLRYLVHSPSLQERGIAVSDELAMIEHVDGPGLASLLWGDGKANTFRSTRLIFF